MAGTLGSGGRFDTWENLIIRSIGLWGMVILPVGVAVLSSLCWRVEHQGGNRVGLLTQPHGMVRVLVAKIVAITLLSVGMQALVVLATMAVGAVAGLPGTPPVGYFLAQAVVVVACAAVAAFQSTVSAFTGSFAAPVATGFVFSGLGTISLLADLPLLTSLPHALLTRSTQLGTGLGVEATATMFSAETPLSTVLLILVSLGWCALIPTATTVLIRRTDALA